VTAYLADTHIALWVWDAPERIPQVHLPVLASGATVYLSIAALWEMTIKAGIGKLTIPDRLAQTFESDGFTLLEISVRHVEATKELPHIHGDPFDRLMIAQAKVEELTIITVDQKFAAYDVPLI